ncbi:MAG: SDR family NAD(P)-dependent oxidoreductase, partial [Limnobacter sp.]|nr:SDR family NAD(P)-dependent oxidoreductase [Limnobacter sp.]
MRFTKKVLLVTGGTQGIGLEVALAAAREGARVTVCGRDTTKGEHAVQQAISQGLEIDFSECDVQDANSVNRMVSQLVNKHGTRGPG